MAFLEQFSKEERDLIVSIPYRTGVWVSAVDGSGNPVSDHDELDRLEKIIAEKSRGTFDSAFVREVMAEAYARHDDWRAWGKDIDTLLADCSKAVGIIAGKMGDKDLDAFRANIMGVGLAVAKAFREFDADASFFAKMIGKIGLFCEAVMRFLKRDRGYDAESELNISLAEDLALAKLSKALHPGLDD